MRTTPKQDQHALTSAEQEFENVSFLKPLVDIMTAKEPSERPTAQGALDMFHIIVRAQSGFFWRWRLRSTNEPVRTRILGDIDSVNCEVRYLMCTCNELLFGKCKTADDTLHGVVIIDSYQASSRSGFARVEHACLFCPIEHSCSRM